MPLHQPVAGSRQAARTTDRGLATANSGCFFPRPTTYPCQGNWPAPHKTLPIRSITHFTEETMVAQRGQVSCPESHSQKASDFLVVSLGQEGGTEEGTRLAFRGRRGTAVAGGATRSGSQHGASSVHSSPRAAALLDAGEDLQISRAQCGMGRDTRRAGSTRCPRGAAEATLRAGHRAQGTLRPCPPEVCLLEVSRNPAAHALSSEHHGTWKGRGCASLGTLRDT